MKHGAKNVKPMAGFISLRWIVKKSGIIKIEGEDPKDTATLHVDAMGEGTEALTEARIDDEVIIIMDPKESVAYGHEDLDVKYHRILAKPKNIAAVLTPKQNKHIN